MLQAHQTPESHSRTSSRPPRPESFGTAPESPSGARCANPRCRGTLVPGSADRSPGSGSSGEGPARLCEACRNRLRRDLDGLPALYDECESVLGNPTYHLTERVSGSKGTGIPLNTHAMTARSEIMALLASWAGLVISERRLAAAPARTVPGLSSFLAAHLNWLVAHPAAEDFAEEVCGAVRMAHTAAQPGPSLHIELGTCVQPGCDSALYATGRAGDDRPMSQVRCGAGHVWSARDWLLVAHRIGRNGSGASAGSSASAGTGDSGRRGPGVAR